MNMTKERNMNNMKRIIILPLSILLICALALLPKENAYANSYIRASWYQEETAALDHIYGRLYDDYDEQCFKDGTYLNEILNDNIEPEGVEIYLDFGYFTEYVDTFKALGRIPQDYRLPASFYTIEKAKGTYKRGWYNAPYITTDCPEMRYREDQWITYYTTGDWMTSIYDYTPKYIRESKGEFGNNTITDNKKVNTGDIIPVNKFDYEYYLSQNPDVKQAFGTDKSLVYNHYLSFGIKEGRKARQKN